jgi:long-chain acyl-CoA synthetase
MARANLLGLLEDAARWGEQTAFSRRRGLRLERWSWARLRDESLSMAGALDSRGLARGDRVLLIAPPGPEWVAAFWACLLRGAVAVPLDVDSPPSLVDRVMRQTEAHSRIDSMRLEDLARDARDGGHEVLGPPDLDRDALAEIVYTSGTTAEPRGVCLTHGNLLANVEPLEREIHRHARLARILRPLRFLGALPLTHVYGQMSTIFVPPLLGAEVHFPHSLRARDIVEAVRRRRVNVMPCVPRQLEILREHVEREAGRHAGRESLERTLSRADGWSWPRRWWAFRHVRRAFGWQFWVLATGGAALSRATEVFWRRLGYVVLQGYGLTETAALATLDDPFRSRRGSIGRPLPGREIRVDEHGQLLVRGDAVSPGYWKGGVEPLTDERGWLPTGDVVERDASGALYFRGRARDVIVTSSGKNVFPADLEAALDAQPEVRSSAVVAHEGPSGPEPVAVLLLKKPSPEVVPEVLVRANERLASYQQLRRALVWSGPDFPRTAGTQKVRKAVLEEWVRRRLGPATRTGDGRGPRRDDRGLARLIAGAGGEVSSGLDDDTTLAELNLDSLGQLELLSALEERYQVDLDESILTPRTTVGELATFLSEGATPTPTPYPYPTWAQHAVTKGIRSLLQALVVLPIARTLCWARVSGREHLGAIEGPALLVCNHVSMVDAGLVVSVLPWSIRHRLAIAMQGEILRDWRRPPADGSWLRRLWGPPLYAFTVLLFGVFSLPQKSGFRHSFDFAGELVDQGRWLLVFPEGRRTPDGHLQPFQTGIGLLAAGLGVPVVPLRIDGLYALKKRRRYVAWPGEVTLTFGEPVRYVPGTDATAITADLEGRVEALPRSRSPEDAGPRSPWPRRH